LAIGKPSDKTAIQPAQQLTNLNTGAAALADHAVRHYACSRRECKGSCREQPPERGRLSSFVQQLDLYCRLTGLHSAYRLNLVRHLLFYY